MYHILSLFLMLAVVDHGDGFQEYRPRYRPWPGHRYQPEAPRNFEEIDNFNTVLRNYIKADASFEKYCYDHSPIEPVITYGFDNCVVTYTVPYDAKFNIDIRIKNKMLRTLVLMNTDDPDYESFTDVRVLPDILDFNEAVWSINDGELNITIPYKVPLGIGYAPRCDTVDNEVIFVPISQMSQSISEDETSAEPTSNESTSQESTTQSTSSNFEYRMIE